MPEEDWVGAKEDSEGKSAQFAYLDLLATTLTEHEKNLDKLIRRLEVVSRDLSKIGAKVGSSELASAKRGSPRADVPETLVYMKMKVTRPTEELRVILDSLKE